MANTIKLKRGTSTPSTSDIASGEVAIDTSAKKLYVNDSGTVKEIGGGGGVTSDAQNNTVAGSDAGDSFSGTDATNNTLFGKSAGTAITSGDNNACYGYDSGTAITTGEHNVFMGSSTGNAVTVGGKNIGIGKGALAGMQTGSNCVAVGYLALKVTTGAANIGIGSQAGEALSTGWGNVIVGGWAASSNLTTGTGNNIMGYNSGNTLTTGSYNTILGNGDDSPPNTLTTGSNNTVIGHRAAVSSATVSNEITLGDTNITKFRIPGLNFSIKDSTATDNYVLTVDSNGDAGWEEASGGGATGGGSDKIFQENGQTVTTNYTIGTTLGAACNALSAGPITINNSITVTIDSGDVWTIV